MTDREQALHARILALLAESDRQNDYLRERNEHYKRVVAELSGSVTAASGSRAQG